MPFHTPTDFALHYMEPSVSHDALSAFSEDRIPTNLDAPEWLSFISQLEAKVEDSGIEDLVDLYGAVLKAATRFTATYSESSDPDENAGDRLEGRSHAQDSFDQALRVLYRNAVQRHVELPQPAGGDVFQEPSLAIAMSAKYLKDLDAHLERFVTPTVIKKDLDAPKTRQMISLGRLRVAEVANWHGGEGDEAA